MNVFDNAERCKCGGEPAIIKCIDPKTLEDWYYLRCSVCKNSERGAHATPAEAISAWNEVISAWK